MRSIGPILTAASSAGALLVIPLRRAMKHRRAAEFALFDFLLAIEVSQVVQRGERTALGKHIGQRHLEARLDRAGKLDPELQ